MRPSLTQPGARSGRFVWGSVLLATLTLTVAAQVEAYRHAAFLAQRANDQQPGISPVDPRPPWYRNMAGWMHGLGLSDAGMPLVTFGAALCWPAFGPGQRDVATGRPCVRRAGPGRVAAALCLAVLVAALFGSARDEWLDPIWRRPSGTRATASPLAERPSIFWIRVSRWNLDSLGLTIGAAWIFLAVAGRWRRRPEDLVERLGRWLGWAWIGLAATLKILKIS